MLTVNQAIEYLLAAATVQADVEVIPLKQALNRTLAEAVVAPLSVPPADNSSMDGYAYRLSDAVAAGFELPVSQRITAGTAPLPLPTGTAARIFTGAEIPAGADAVAMQEDCTVHEAAALPLGTMKTTADRLSGRLSPEAEISRVTVPRDQSAGANIRRCGQDITINTTVLLTGTSLRAQEQGLLASLGLDSVAVYKPLRVAVFATGDELVAAGQPLAPGQIYNANNTTLNGLLAGWGMTVIDLGIVSDDPASIATVLRVAASEADVVVTSGGVSVGEEDHVKAVVESLGRLTFWKIAIKPGKPLAFGEVLGIPFVGLPGNPASVFVTALVLLRPFLLSLQGQRETTPLSVPVPALFERAAVGREEYLRSRLTPAGIEIHPNQNSGMLSSACWGEGLAVHPVGCRVMPGDLLRFLPYNSFF